MESLMVSVGTAVTAFVVVNLLSFLFRRIVLERRYLPKEGAIIVITGCDSGFGYDSAIRLVRGGCTVIAGCYLEASLTALKEAVGPTLAEKMVTRRLNLDQDECVDEFVRGVQNYLKDHGKSLYGYVNNAGLFAAGPSEWIRRDQMRRLFNVNCIQAMELSNRMAPLLEKGGRLVSISSVSAVVHGPQLALYGATKAALDNFHSAMRVETQRPFSVSLVMPGGFRTPLLNPTALRNNISSTWEKAPESVRQDYGERYFSTFVSNWTEGVVRFANSRPAWVVENVEHALFAVNPRDRYYTGYDAIALFAILSFSPTWLQDRVLRRANARFFKAPTGEQVSMACYDKPADSKPKAA